MSGLIIELHLDDVLAPWTLQGPYEVTEDGNTHWEMTIEELPDFFVAAETYEEVVAEVGPALRAYLASFEENGQAPPTPRSRWLVQALVLGAASTEPVARVVPEVRMQGRELVTASS